MADDGTAMLSGIALCKRFNALVVLNEVNFSIGKGEAVGIVGPNGAGKTTLLNVLSGAYPPSAGQIIYHGADVSTLGAAARCRRGIARSHQIPRPFTGLTVFENLHVAASIGGGLSGAAANQRCIESLEMCGMVATANRRAETLGLLDRKRLEMARALATGPDILLLDEIGGGLTDAEAAALVVMIKAINARGVAIVWIEHIVHVLLQVVTRLVCMDAGQILADGSPAAVMADPHVIAAYLGPGSGHMAAA